MTEHSRPTDSSSCIPASMRSDSDYTSIPGIPGFLNPDYSQPQSKERTGAWWTLGTALLVAGLAIVSCDSRSEAPELPAQVVEITGQNQHTGSLLDAFGPIALNG